MGFFRGVVTGIAVAAGVAAWYMSRSGQQIREQYKVEQRLGELGDQLEARTREIQGTLNAQLAEMRSKGMGGADETGTVASIDGRDVAETLDATAASAAEAAAASAAEADALTAKVKAAARDVAEPAAD
jgi:hypothetical protein